MIKGLIALGIIFFIAVLSIGAYLGPNDLRACGGAPNGHASCQRADAIVAVSGGDTSARAGEAIQLYQNGWGKKLIFSGAASDPNSPSNASVMRQQALAAGVPADKILIDGTSQTTQQNATHVHTIFTAHGIHSVILVTSAYHQRRAYLEFTHYNPHINVRNHPVHEDGQWSGLWWLTPGGWWLAGGELVRIVAFYLGDSR